jgi:hypothetical protein
MITELFAHPKSSPPTDLRFQSTLRSIKSKHKPNDPKTLFYTSTTKFKNTNFAQKSGKKNKRRNLYNTCRYISSLQLQYKIKIKIKSSENPLLTEINPSYRVIKSGPFFIGKIGMRKRMWKKREREKKKVIFPVKFIVGRDYCWDEKNGTGTFVVGRGILICLRFARPKNCGGSFQGDLSDLGLGQGLGFLGKFLRFSGKEYWAERARERDRVERQRKRDEGKNGWLMKEKPTDITWVFFFIIIFFLALLLFVFSYYIRVNWLKKWENYSRELQLTC